jgi:putative transposase
MVLDRNWTSFREGRATYDEDPSKFLERPRIPKYEHKTEGRNILIYTLQALKGGQSKKGIQGNIKPSGLPFMVKTQQQAIHQVHIIPRNGNYVVEVVYSKKPVQAQVDPSFCVAIDLGVTNLAAITSNRVGFVPRLVNGRTLKSINQWYNKRMKELKLCLPKADRDRTTNFGTIADPASEIIPFGYPIGARHVFILPPLKRCPGMVG